MIDLRLLGGLALEEKGVPLTGPATRRRSLALLALLAAAETRGVAREQLLIYLWPESNTQRARNSLNQTLWAIRQHLGEDLVVGTTTLRLNPERVTCDLWEYREALRRGDVGSAVRLRHGELLETFALPGLPEFEQWLASERARDGRSFREALERSAHDAARAGDPRGATAYWQRLAIEEPLSARAARECVQALAASGDLPGALAHAQAYAARVRAELGTEPAAEVVLLAAGIRERLANTSASMPAATTGTHGERAGALPPRDVPAEARAGDGSRALFSGIPYGYAESGAAPTAPDPANGGSPVPAASAADAAAVSDARLREEGDAPLEASATQPLRGPPRAAATPTRAMRWPVAGAVVVLALALWWIIPRSRVGSAEMAAARASETQSVLIFPFAVHGTRDAQHLSAALPSLLVSGLDGAGGLRAAGLGAQNPTAGEAAAGDWRAERIAAEAARRGVDFFITGEVVVSGEKVRVRASLHRRGVAEPLATSSVEGMSAALFEVADDIALHLLQQWPGDGVGRSVRPRTANTASLPALRAYLMGEAALRGDRYAESIEAFRRAVAADSTFALAYYRLSVAAELATDQQLAVEAADRAILHAAELPERERLLIAALQALRAGREDVAETLYRRVAAEYPADPEGWFGLGEVLFHHGPLRGQSVTAARAAYERVLQLDPRDAESLIHLARIAFLEGRSAEADALVRRARQVVPDSNAVEIRAVRAFALGDRPGLKYVTRQLLAHPRQIPGATAIQVAVYHDDLAGAESFARTLLGPAEARITRGFAHRLLAQAALARGRVTTAERELATSATIDATPTLELRSLYVTFPLFAFPRSTVAAVLSDVEAWHTVERADSLHTAAHEGLHEHIRLHRLGVLRLALGDTAGADAAATALERLRGDERSVRYARTLASSVRARRAAAAGRSNEALALLDRADWTPAAEVFVAEVADRFLRAELLEQVGRPHDALRWYESIAQRAIYELVYLAPATLRQAAIHDRLGNRTRALQSYRRFIELWRDCDPGLRPVLGEAQRRIAELERAR